jgi:protocatechuate 3,4-dioxygenase beta subunit
MALRRLGVVMALAAVLVPAAAPAAGGARAADCRPSPNDGAGPFGRGQPPKRAKIGAGHVLTGVVLSTVGCRPLAGATVELWQANAKGRYTRAGSATVVTDRGGRFRFEGPKPAGYEGRPGHIHLRISAAGHLQLFTRYEPGIRTRGSVRLVLDLAPV